MISKLISCKDKCIKCFREISEYSSKARRATKCISTQIDIIQTFMCLTDCFEKDQDILVAVVMVGQDQISKLSFSSKQIHQGRPCLSYMAREVKHQKRLFIAFQT